MARMKVTAPAVSVSNMDDVDASLARIGERQREIDLAVITLKEGIDGLKKNHEAAIADSVAEIDANKLALFKYAEANKSLLFKAKKSIARAFGIFGFRQSTKLTMDKGWKKEQLPGLIKEAGLAKECLRIKEEADVEAMRGLPPEKLAQLRCRFASADEFFIELPEPQTSEDVA